MAQYTHKGKTGGKFFVIEGPDGVGKTTISAKVASALSKTNEIVLTQDPVHLPISSKIRSWTKTITLSPLHQAALFLAARTELLIEVVFPALVKDKYVICDRFYHSMIAYQGSRMSYKSMSTMLAAIDTEPDMVFILTDTWETIKSRVGEGRDLLEKEEILKPAFDAYKLMGTSECLYTFGKTNICHINASCIDTAVADILRIIDSQ